MKWNDISSTFASTTGLGRIFQFALVTLFCLNVGLSLKLLGKDAAPRTIVVPAHLTESFWVDDEQVSPEYLTQMGQFLVSLWVDVSPNSAEFQTDEFLRYVNPTYQGVIKERIKNYIASLKKNQQSNVFYPYQAIPDQKNSRLILRGTQKIFIGKEAVKSEEVNYLLQFRYNAGKITLTGFCQTENEDLYAAKNPKICTQ